MGSDLGSIEPARAFAYGGIEGNTILIKEFEWNDTGTGSEVSTGSPC